MTYSACTLQPLLTTTVVCMKGVDVCPWALLGGGGGAISPFCFIKICWIITSTVQHYRPLLQTPASPGRFCKVLSRL